MSTYGDGKLCEFPGELKIEWKVEVCYPRMTFKSPPLYFAGASWQFRLYPDSVTNDVYNLCLELSRLSFGTSFNLEVTVVRSVDGKKEQPKTDTYNYIDDEISHLIAQWPGKQLYEKMPRYSGSFPSVTLTCTLKNKETLNITNSLLKRLSVLTDNIKNLNNAAKDTDLTLVMGGCKFPVHRLILKARSAKFAQDIQKMKTDEHELHIDDINPNLMWIILDYLYKGDTNLQDGYYGDNKLITESEAFSTYIIAKKYELEELKAICSEYIRQHLTVDWLFDVMKFADEQEAKEIKDFATEFFVANVAKITETHSWEKFSREHKDKSIELLTCSVKKRIT